MCQQDSYLGWIPRNFKAVIFEEHHTNDNSGEFPDFYEFTLYLNFVFRKWPFHRSSDGYYRSPAPDKAHGLVLKLIKAVVEALAKMHEADPTKIGLESYGKLEGYLKRNETWIFLLFFLFFILSNWLSIMIFDKWQWLNWWINLFQIIFHHNILRFTSRMEFVWPKNTGWIIR